MEPIQLGCAVFGEDWQFVVTIPRTVQVAVLQKAIGAKILSGNDPIKPSKLKLYLAWKCGAWLKKARHSELAEVSGDAIDPAFKVMKPLFNVSDYLVKVDPTNDKGRVVHVIVKRPTPLDAERPAPISLAVAVLDEDWQFVVEIPHDAQVAELQKAIGAEMLSSDDPTEPTMLKLYLAWKNGAWVKTDEYSEPAELSGDVVDLAFVVMDPLVNVSDYLVNVGPKNDKGGVIHVIVKRPPPLRRD